MIKLKKLAEPEVLQKNKAAWTQEFVGAKAANAMTNTIKFRYRHADIKTQIRRETSGKCVYCESKIGHVCPGDIEHIIPHSKIPELVVDWENLTLGCVECNRRKGAYYSQQEPLLNPYSDEPGDHLQAFGTVIFGRAGDAMGKLTQLQLDLNRKELIERRLERIESLRRLTETYVSQAEGRLKDLIRDELLAEVAEDKEYAFVTRVFVKQYADLEHR
jgi:hypothetical protein